MQIALVDGNNLGFKVYSQLKESRGGLLKTSMGVPTTVIFGMLRSFTALSNKMSFDKIVICWDVTGSKYRKGIFPLYKSHRKYIDMKDYFEELDSARLYLKKFGFNQMIVPGIEADDVIGFVAHSLADSNNKVIVVSDDKDFYQITRKHVRLYRPIKEEFVTRSMVVEQYGMEPNLLPRIKAITGEDTDFIPGVCDINEKEKKLIKFGLGEANAIKILKDRKNLKDAIERCDIERWSELVKRKRKQILISYKLARIRTKIKWYADWEKELLKNYNEIVLADNSIEVKKVNRLANDLEIKAFNVPMILRKLGVKIIGSGLIAEGKVKV